MYRKAIASNQAGSDISSYVLSEPRAAQSIFAGKAVADKSDAEKKCQSLEKQLSRNEAELFHAVQVVSKLCFAI